MKVLINNLDLSFTIDTYGMFTGDSFMELEVEYYNDQNNTDLNSDNSNWSFDHKSIVRDFAESSISYLWSELKDDGIVKDIEYQRSTSPEYYNYTTDSYSALWTLEHEKLLEYIEKHKSAYNDFVTDGWHNIDLDDTDNRLVPMLDFYTSQEIDVESYESYMFEIEFEVYSNNVEIELDKKVNSNESL